MTLADSDHARQVVRARRIGLIMCALVGWIAAWNARHDLNPDGLSYLDIADALQRGDWSAALNRYWNPLYPALLALLARPATIGPEWEFAAAHAINFALYLTALFSFDAFLLLLARSSPPASVPRGAWLLIGYAAFLWATVGLTGLDVVSPDLLLLTCLTVGFCLFLRSEARETRARAALLVACGAVFGLGYLAKTVMLPVAALFLLSVFVASGFRLFVASGFSRKILPIALGFLLPAAPYIAAMSVDRGRLTIGESGRLNLAWKVGGVTSYFFPRGDEAARLIHPPRVLCTEPRAFEFGGMPVTYPPWYDPAYWYEGLTPHFTMRGQVDVLRNAALTSYVLLRRAWPLVALLLLLAWGARFKNFRQLAWEVRAVQLTCALALAMYAVVELSPRLAAPFFPALVATVFLWPAPSRWSQRTRTVAGTGAAVILMAMVALPVGARCLEELSLIRRGRPVHEHLELKRQLVALGLSATDRAGVIGEGYGAYWARLARVRIVAEAPDADQFWQASAEDRRRCIERFRSTGARLIVTYRARLSPDLAWEPLGTTGYHALRLQP